MSTVYTDVDDGLAGPDDTTANAPSSKSTVPGNLATLVFVSIG